MNNAAVLPLLFEVKDICETSNEIINALVPTARELLSAGLEPGDVMDVLYMAVIKLEKQKAARTGLRLV